MKISRKDLLAAIAVGAVLFLSSRVAPAQQSSPQLSSEQIAQIVASPDRSAVDRTNDLRRKPEQMLGFIGIRPMALAAVAALLQRRPDPGRVRRHPLLPVAGRYCGPGRVRRPVPRRRAIHSLSDPRQGSIGRLNQIAERMISIMQGGCGRRLEWWTSTPMRLPHAFHS
jgi:hypothetical protein